MAGTEGNQRYFLRVCADTIESTQSCLPVVRPRPNAPQTWSSAGAVRRARLAHDGVVGARQPVEAGGRREDELHRRRHHADRRPAALDGPHAPLACDASQTAPLLTNPTDDGAGHYTLTVKAKAACPRTPQPPRTGGSPSSSAARRSSRTSCSARVQQEGARARWARPHPAVELLADAPRPRVRRRRLHARQRPLVHAPRAEGRLRVPRPPEQRGASARRAPRRLPRCASRLPPPDARRSSRRR